MTTYLLLELALIATVVILDVAVLGTMVVRRRSTWLALAVLLLMTAAFDSLLTGLPIVTYDASRILGFKLGSIPVEDFAYALAAAILVPAVYSRLARTEARHADR